MKHGFVVFFVFATSLLIATQCKSVKFECDPGYVPADGGCSAAADGGEQLAEEPGIAEETPAETEPAAGEEAAEAEFAGETEAPEESEEINGSQPDQILVDHAELLFSALSSVQSLVVELHFPDDSLQDITATAAYTVVDEQVAVVHSAGRIRSVAEGHTQLHIVFGDLATDVEIYVDRSSPVLLSAVLRNTTTHRDGFVRTGEAVEVEAQWTDMTLDPGTLTANLVVLGGAGDADWTTHANGLATWVFSPVNPAVLNGTAYVVLWARDRVNRSASGNLPVVVDNLAPAIGSVDTHDITADVHGSVADGHTLEIQAEIMEANLAAALADLSNLGGNATQGPATLTPHVGGTTATWSIENVVTTPPSGEVPFSITVTDMADTVTTLPLTIQSAN